MSEDDRSDLPSARDEQSRADLLAPHPVRVALAGRCPRCGQGRLFAGWLKVRSECDVCGLELSAIQAGDGAATFIMQIVGFLVGFSALYVEIAFHPPMWLHLIVWLPMVALLALALMRPGKGLMIALHYRSRSEGKERE